MGPRAWVSGSRSRAVAAFEAARLPRTYLYTMVLSVQLVTSTITGQQCQWNPCHKRPTALPGSAVIAFRTWMGRMAGGGIPYAGEGSSATPTAASAASTFASAAAAPPAPLRPRSLPPGDRAKGDVFDTYHTHTEQCTVCLKALGRLRAARVAAVVGAVAGVLAGMCVGVQTGPGP